MEKKGGRKLEKKRKRSENIRRRGRSLYEDIVYRV
jgi:hypothetical protein